MIGGLMKSTSKFALVAAAGLFAGGMAMTPAQAADLGGDCCADLEERVAELEATTVRKGNRKVSLELSGQVNRAVVWWDDGEENDLYSVGNNNSGSRFRMKGKATIGRGWTAGYLLEIGLRDTLSDGVSQLDDDTNADGNFRTLYVRHDVWFLDHDRYGTFSVGHSSTASDGTSEVDLSGSGVVAYADPSAWSGSFFLRDPAVGLNGLIPFTWGQTSSYFDGLGRGDAIIRYDSPTFAGFTLSATIGEDDAWDVALRYAGEFGGIRVAAAVAYASLYGDDAPIMVGNELTRLGGSFSALHMSTGLFVTFAAGQQTLDVPVVAGADDPFFWYLKAGIYRKFWDHGKTSLYGEYGQYRDGFVGQMFDWDNMGAISTVTDSELTVWGFGIVQHIDAAAMEIYLAYRHYEITGFTETELDTTEDDFEDFRTIAAGARIKF